MELSDAAVGEVVESMMTYSMATAGSHISSPQGPVDFYEILKVPRTAADSTIIEAHVQQLVSIPYVAQYMERYVRADAAEWDALWDAFRHFRQDPVGDKTRYEALLHAHARVRSGHASDSSYEVLGVTRHTDLDEVARTLKVKLLLIPRCDLWINLYPGLRFCAQCEEKEPSPTAEDLERWEQVRVATFILEQKRDFYYDEDLDADPDPTSRWRVTRRHIFLWRTKFMNKEELEGRLDWLCDPHRCPCPILSPRVTPDSPWDAAWDERRYLCLVLSTRKELEWLTARVSTLRAQLAEPPEAEWSSYSRELAEWKLENHQRRGELRIMEAAITTWTRRKEAKRKTTTQLEARRKQLLDLMRADDRVPSPRLSVIFRLADAALRRANFMADACSIGVQWGFSDERSEAAEKQGDRLRQAEMRIDTLDANREIDSMEDERGTVCDICTLRHTSKHILCTECKAYEAESFFRREDGGRIARTQRCHACEFPRCAACGRSRQESEGPVLIKCKEKKADGRREEGLWYLRHTQTDRQTDRHKDRHRQ
jgi:hypothetical protein